MTGDAPASVPRAGYAALAAAATTLTVAFSFGLFSLPVFYTALVAELGWTRAQAAGGGSIVLLLIGVLGPAIGKLADRYTPKLVLLNGILVGALALTLLSYTQRLPLFYTFCAILGIGSAAVSLVPTSMLIAPWFPSRRGLAVGVINAGVGIGGFLAPNLTRKLLAVGGIPQAFAGLAMCMAVPFFAVLLLAPQGPAAWSSERRAASTVKASEVLRMPMFWIFGMALFFSAHTLTGIQQHLALYLTGQGAGAARAAFALSVLLGASAFGKVAGGWIADRHSARASLLASIVCLVTAIAGLLAVDPASALVYACAAVFGLGYGGVFNAPPLIAFEFFGTKGVGTILGMFMMFFGLGTSSGGLVAGAIFDRTQTYAASFTVSMISCSIGFVLLALAAKLRPAARAAAEA
jgi:MFS family permease